MSTRATGLRLPFDGRATLRSARWVAAVTIETLTRPVDAGSRRNAMQALNEDRFGDGQRLAHPDGTGSARAI